MRIVVSHLNGNGYCGYMHIPKLDLVGHRISVITTGEKKCFLHPICGSKPREKSHNFASHPAHYWTNH